MKPVGVLILLVLAFSQVSVVHAQYPRHVDPSLYEVEEPDPDVLFLLYHDIYLGMLLDNMTIQAEWLQWADEVYSVPDLSLLFETYTGNIEFIADSLNLTRYYFDETRRYLGEFNLTAAQSSFFQGFAYLKQSNASIPVLRDYTAQLGARFKADPGILYEDLDALQALIDRYDEFAQLLIDTSTSVDLDSVIVSSLMIDANVTSVWVGSGVEISGILSAGGVGLGGRVVSLMLGETDYRVTTDSGGYFVIDLRVPYLYMDSIIVRALYWPTGGDAKTYSPAGDLQTLLLLFNVPELDLSYSMSALPGRSWSLSGVMRHDYGRLSGFDVGLMIFGDEYYVVSDVGGGFGFDVLTADAQPIGSVSVIVFSEPSGVYCGVSERLVVDVVQLPLEMEVELPEWVLSGFMGRFRASLMAGGLPVDGCELRLVGEGDSGVGYSVDGVGSVVVAVPLFRFSGDYDWRLVADPLEPWIGGASLSDSFYVVNTVAVLFGVGCVAVFAYYLWRYLGGRKGRVEETLEPVEPVFEPVVESVVVNSFSGIFLVALRVVERLSGVVMAPSDTLREYLARVFGGVGGRFAEVFRELVARYELWLYGRPHEVELGDVEVLIAELEEDHDEG